MINKRTRKEEEAESERGENYGDCIAMNGKQSGMADDGGGGNSMRNDNFIDL